MSLKTVPNYSNTKRAAVIDEGGEFVMYIPKNANDTIIVHRLHQARQAILRSRDFEALRRITKRFYKSLQYTSDEIETKTKFLDRQPWKYLTMHGSVMNRKSSTCKTMLKYADSIFDETELPRKPEGYFRGRNGVDLESVISYVGPSFTMPNRAIPESANDYDTCTSIVNEETP